MERKENEQKVLTTTGTDLATVNQSAPSASFAGCGGAVHGTHPRFRRRTGASGKGTGPLSPAANILFRLRDKRAKDRQVHVWKVGPYYYIGPAPDAETEMAMHGVTRKRLASAARRRCTLQLPMPSPSRSFQVGYGGTSVWTSSAP
jgi:hypothetical protein